MIRTLSISFLLFLTFTVTAQRFPDPPDPPKLVNDYTNTLSKQETAALENKLVAYNDSTSTQIAIVILSSLDGYPIEDYSFSLAEKWGIGQKGKSNGVLVLVAKDDRKIFIATGYGMEGVMPDGLVKRIIENEIKPEFRNGNYYEGLDRATTAMFQLAAGEYTAEPVTEKKGPPWTVIAGIIIFVILMLYMQVRRVRDYATVNSIGFWTAWELLNQARRTHHGSWGGFSGRGWGGGGGGGGGFGGFGGGSFGGGGAGGSW